MSILLNQTLDKLEEHKITVEEILWCGSKDFGWFTWEDFKVLADIEYDCGYGALEVAKDILIVGKDFWLERQEYDGAEWWEFKRAPERPENYRKPVALTTKQARNKGFNTNCDWENLQEMNGDCKGR